LGGSERRKGNTNDTSFRSLDINTPGKRGYGSRATGAPIKNDSEITLSID
tara:strand:- start:348 stop:497 length:150 start_codon:yes stop_codon:yes gene_type:complete